jgi:hypothetical protein
LVEEGVISKGVDSTARAEQWPEHATLVLALALAFHQDASGVTPPAITIMIMIIISSCRSCYAPRALAHTMKAFLTRSASGGVKRLRRHLSTEGSQGTLGAATWRGVPRFYQHCGAAPHPSGEGWQVLIEGRPLRSNAAAELTLPSQGLALAIAGEFASQGAMIVPATTALYNLASTAADTWYPSADAAGSLYTSFADGRVCTTPPALPAMAATPTRR